MKKLFKVRLEQVTLHEIEVDVDPEVVASFVDQAAEHFDEMTPDERAACMVDSVKWETEVEEKMRMSFIPRAVVFRDDKGVCAGCPAGMYVGEPGCVTKTIELPTDHYDFAGPVSVLGKTEEEILREVETYREVT